MTCDVETFNGDDRSELNPNDVSPIEEIDFSGTPTEGSVWHLAWQKSRLAKRLRWKVLEKINNLQLETVGGDIEQSAQPMDPKSPEDPELVEEELDEFMISKPKGWQSPQDPQKTY